MTNWQTFMKQEQEKAYMYELREFLKQERAHKIIFPKKEDVFNALKLCPYDNVKVVILGQDPYHNDNQAHGLSFSVQEGVVPPPSLQNIFKEISDDMGCDMSYKNGDLTKWAKQGVLLLNAVLTVEKGKPNSHANRGWEQFTDGIISLLNDKQDPVIFVLWGSYAQKKAKLITQSHHIVLCAPHPSPLSAYRGFFGSKPFSKINHLLIKQGKTPIDWVLTTK